MAGKIWAALEPERVQVDAGGQPATVVVAVQSLGAAVDHLTVEVEGLDQSWYTIAGSVLQLFPNERGQAQIHFQVPRRSDTRSGTYPFTVRVRSRVDPAEVGTAQGVLEIKPYSVYRFDVMPKRVLGQQGRFRAIVQNAGTADIEVQLQGKDPEALCRFGFRTDRPRVVPGADNTVPFTVRPRRSSVVGEPKTFNLTVSATPDSSSEAKSVSVQFVHQPRFRSWKPIVWLALLGIIAVALVTTLVWPAWLQPQANETFASTWASAQDVLCKATNNAVACPEGSATQKAAYKGFERFHKVGADVVGQAVEDEWKDSGGNNHQLTTKGHLLWIGATDSYYFFSGNKIFVLTKDDKVMEEAKRR